MTETFLFKPSNLERMRVMEMQPGCVELDEIKFPQHQLGFVDLAFGARLTLAQDISPFALCWTDDTEKRLLMVRAADLEADL